MKKILAAILAAAMTLSLGITAFAAPATVTSFTVDFTGTADATNADVPKMEISITAGNITFTGDAVTTAGGLTAADVAASFKTKKSTIVSGYTVTDVTGTVVTITANATGLPAAGLSASSVVAITGAQGAGSPTTLASFKAGTLPSGTDAFDSSTMLISDTVGPIAMVESASDLNAGDGVKTGTSILFMIDKDEYSPDDFSFSVSKADNAKNIAKVSIVDKNFSSKLIAVGSANTARKSLVNGTDGRNTFVQVELKENFTDAEFKISFTLKAKCTSKTASNSDGTFVKGDNITFKSVGKAWVANTVLDADQDFVNGTSGIVLKPQKNEDNEITWEDENDTVARLTFVGDSNVAKFYPKLSTKWDNADYAELFADQNAFYFDFVGNMGNQTQISSTSRATLEIYNPYYDKETDELTVDPTEIVIYQVATDGSFTDVSDQFTVGENDDGDSVYTTKTRELGTYIFAEKVLAAVEEEVVEAPAKDIPNTGR